jgi:integrase/recombinase XerD
MSASSDYSEMEIMIRRYLQWMEATHYSIETIKSRRLLLKYFCLWCEERGIVKPQEVTRGLLERYQRYLTLYRDKKEKPISRMTQCIRITAVRMFFGWLAKHNHILYNPSSELDLLRQEQKLPAVILSHEEIEQILQQVDLNEPMGYLDRAILETLYSTGIRRKELCNLEIHDLDMEKELVMVRQSKYNKDRLIPISERALVWIEKYLSDVRPFLLPPEDNHYLFLSHFGGRLIPKELSRMARKYFDRAGLQKHGDCHIFRHSMATNMHENGADISYIQEILGHASVETTQIYPHVSIARLKEVHNRTHPGAKFETKRLQNGDKEADSPK